MKLAVLLVLFSLLSFVLTQSDTPGVCVLSGLPPQNPRYNLGFCRGFSGNICCKTGHDSDIEEAFTTLTDLGRDCPYRRRNNAVELNDLYCLGCDPFAQNPDGNVITFISEETISNSTTRFINVCSDFADRIFPPLEQTRYDDCGLRIINRDCASTPFDECGDDIVVPSVEYGNDMDSVAAQEAFLTAILPPLFATNFQVKVVENDGTQVCFRGSASGIAPMVLLSLVGSLLFF